MRWRVERLVWAFVVAQGLSAGSAVYHGGGSSPLETLRIARRAALTGDTETFASCFEADRSVRDLLRARCEAIHAAETYRRAMRLRLGRSWRAGDLPTLRLAALLDDPGLLGRASFQGEGGRVLALLPTAGTEVVVTETNSRWKIDPDCLLSWHDVNDPRFAAGRARYKARAYRQAARRVLIEGAEPETVRRDLARRIRRADEGRM
jgi:hypothetical protein